MTNTTTTTFDFNSSHSGTVFTDNPSYLQRVIDDAFASEHRGKAPQIKFIGSTQYGFDAYLMDTGGYIRVLRRAAYRLERQKHSLVIFPTFVGMSNDRYKSQFTHVHGKWAWNG